MALLDLGNRDDVARRKRRALLAAEQAVEEATDAAMRQFLRRCQQSLTPAALTAAAGQGVSRPAHLFTLGQATGWWEDAVDQHVVDAVASVWRSGYFDTRDGELLRTSLDGIDGFLASVTDRLSRTAQPTIPDQAMNIARVALADEMARGAPIRDVSQRLAAEFGWDEDATYWRGQLDRLNTDADRILDRIGPPGHPEREATRTGRIPDAELQRIQDARAEAVRRIDRVESEWQTRSERIARTETTGAYNAGAVQAGHDEGAGVKVWLATGDDRTRDSHLEVSGSCVAVDDTFDVGGALLQMPADPSGPPEETINCRCTVVFARSCDQAAERFGAADEVIDGERARREEQDGVPRRRADDGPDPVGEDARLDDLPAAGEAARYDTLEEADEWGRQQFDGVAERLTEEQRQEITAYSRQDFRNTNALHRGQLDDVGDLTRRRAEEQTRHIEAAMREAGGTKDPVQVFRGVGPEVVDELGGTARDLTNADFTDPAFMSTSLNVSETDYFTRKPGSAVLQIDVPAGTPSLYVDEVTAVGPFAGASAHEAELLLGRNMRVVIDGATGEVNGRGAPIWRAHLEDIGG